jgi:cytochrome c-type biogenesis protein CcmE
MTAPVKLATGVAIVVGVTLYMAYVGASSSWKYYVTAEEYTADAASFSGKNLRVSGKVAADSLAIDASRLRAQFALVSNKGNLSVECVCSVPDNLAEGRDVVVEGRADERGVLVGEKVLTKCASKYQSDVNSQTPRMASKRGEAR